MAIGRTNAGGGNTFSIPNLLDNSDFQHFVAQARVGGNHGAQAYAGDRWILDSGTVTGVANANGDGYSNITLNGTIRQIVANAPAGEHVCAIEMVSGTADISYGDGEVTITSYGGVIKNVGLYAGNRKPKYTSKGYISELLECLSYYYYIPSTKAALTAYSHSTTEIRATMVLPVAMRATPTVTLGELANMDIIPGTKKPSNISVGSISNNILMLVVITTGVTQGVSIALKINTTVEISADL